MFNFKKKKPSPNARIEYRTRILGPNSSFATSEAYNGALLVC